MFTPQLIGRRDKSCQALMPKTLRRNGKHPSPKPMKATIEDALRCALALGQLEMHFQPQVSLEDGAVVGAEALMRWRHPVWGLVPPDQFIPLAERLGLIDSLGSWAIASVCMQLRVWLDAGVKVPRVALNLSVHQLRNEGLVPLVRDCLAMHGLNGQLLEFELTESATVCDHKDAAETLRQLQSLGVRLSLDDFGTGFSSLSRLKLLPMDKLKIDKSFVDQVTTDANDAAICRAVIALAHELGMSVVVEGVETRAQMEHLRDEHCDVMQGHYFSHAVCAQDFELLLSTQLCMVVH